MMAILITGQTLPVQILIANLTARLVRQYFVVGLTISSFPATRLASLLTVVARTAATGPLRLCLLRTPTTWVWIPPMCSQVRAASVSTAACPSAASSARNV